MFGSPGDSEMAALEDIEGHIPSFCPVEDCKEVRLQCDVICGTVNVSINDTIICEESHFGFDILRNVINVRQEQGRAQN